MQPTIGSIVQLTTYSPFELIIEKARASKLISEEYKVLNSVQIGLKTLNEAAGGGD